MITEGHDNNNRYWNLGSAYEGYTDITDKCLDVQIDRGFTDVKKRITEPTKINITLNNESGFFDVSSNSISPLAGIVVRNLPLVVEVYYAPQSLWITLGSAFIDYIDIKANPRIKQATLYAEQQPYVKSNHQFTYDFFNDFRRSEENPDQPVGVVISKIYRRNSWVIPNSSAGIKLSDTTVSGGSTRLVDPETNLIGTQAGEPLNYVSYGWDESTFSNIINSLVYGENGWLFLQRDGKLVFYSNERFRKQDDVSLSANLRASISITHEDLNLGTLGVTPHYNIPATSANISEDKDIRNYIQVPWRYTYKGYADLVPERLTEDITLSDEDSDIYWGQRGDITKTARKFLVREIKYLAVWDADDFEGWSNYLNLYPDGYIHTQAKMIPWDADKSDVIFLNNWKSTSTDTGLSDGRDISVAYVQLTSGGALTRINRQIYGLMRASNTQLGLWLGNEYAETSLYLFNPVRVSAWVNHMGSINTHILINQDSIDKNQAEFSHKIQRTEFTNETQAKRLAKIIEGDHADFDDNVDWFTYTFNDENDENLFGFIRFVQTGQQISLNYKDYTRDIRDQDYVVTGESFSLYGGNMDVKINLVKTEQFLTLDDITTIEANL